MAKAGSYTARRQPVKRLGGGKGSGNKRGKGKPFQKNDPKTGAKDERINRNGRPRSADELKQLIFEIFDEEAENTETGEKLTILKYMLRKMAIAGQPADRSELLNRAVGKVPDAIVLSYDDIQKIIDQLPSDMVDRLVKGDDLGDVIIGWVTALRDGPKKTT